MNRGRKHLFAPAVFGATLLVLLTLSSAAGQRGGGGGDAVANPTEAGFGQALPPAGNPAIKAKMDHDQNLRDATRLAQLADEITQELKSGSALTLSIGGLKKAEEMAKLSKKLHDRMKADYAAAPK